MASSEASPAPRWLDETEMAAWLRLLRIVMQLPGAIDRQLRRDAGLTHGSYMILATLSDAPSRQMRMSELARETATSPSRLSHACSLLERHGWVARQPSPDDRRGQIAVLTDAGVAVLERIAPGHVEQVRRSVFDALDAGEVAQLSALLAKIADPLEPRPAAAAPAGGPAPVESEHTTDHAN